MVCPSVLWIAWSPRRAWLPPVEQAFFLLGARSRSPRSVALTSISAPSAGVALCRPWSHWWRRPVAPPQPARFIRTLADLAGIYFTRNLYEWDCLDAEPYRS